MLIRSSDEPLTSESRFDPLPENGFFSTHCQTVDITKWRENIQDPVTSVQELFFSPHLQALNSTDAELKDTTSEHSMDSAYQSHSSGPMRRRATLRDGHYMFSPQEPRASITRHFVDSDLASPLLSADNFTPFSEPQDANQLNLPVTAETEAVSASSWYTDAFLGQVISPYSNTSALASPHATPFSTEFQWNATDNSALDYNVPFNTSTPNQDCSNSLFSASLLTTTGEIQTQPTAIHSVPTAVMRGPRRKSTHSAGFGPFVTSSMAVQPQPFADMGFDQQLPQSGDTTDEMCSPPSHLQSDDEMDEFFSLMDPIDTKRLEEERNRTARTHQLYQASPGDDGRYHCPYEGEGLCNHKSTSLKCNYDKYVDSHLKPFRCSRKACAAKEFSSTACLLRHEREAHGMHGHGSRPHLCEFSACERAVEGNGFPRRYNLYDHMKRVHDYHGPTADLNPPPKPGRGPGYRKVSARKRKSADEDVLKKRQRSLEASRQQRLEERRIEMRREFANKKQIIIDLLKDLNGPQELKVMEVKLTTKIQELCNLSVGFSDSSDESRGG